MRSVLSFAFVLGVLIKGISVWGIFCWWGKEEQTISKDYTVKIGGPQWLHHH